VYERERLATQEEVVPRRPRRAVVRRVAVESHGPPTLSGASNGLFPSSTRISRMAVGSETEPTSSSAVIRRARTTDKTRQKARGSNRGRDPKARDQSRRRARDRKRGLQDGDREEWDQPITDEESAARAREERAAEKRWKMKAAQDRAAQEAARDEEERQVAEQIRQRQERENAEKQRRQEQEAAQRRRQQEEAARLEALKNWNERGLTPEAFRERIEHALSEADAALVEVPDKEVRKTLELQLASVRGMIGQKSAAMVKSELSKVLPKIASNRVDQRALRRQKVSDDAKNALSSAQRLRDAQQPGEAKKYGDELVARAQAISKRASSATEMDTNSQIDECARQVQNVVDAVKQAATEMTMFDIVQGSFEERRTKLTVLTIAGLGESDIRQYLKVMKVAGSADPAAYLVDVVVVAGDARNIGVKGLLTLLPLADVQDLVHAIVLADCMQCKLTDAAVNCADLVATGKAFDRRELKWFAGMPCTMLKALLAAFPATELAAFAKAVPRPCLDPLVKRGMTCAQLYQYRAHTAVLLNFQALRDDSWKHVYTNIYISGSGQVAGGHDQGMWNLFTQNPPTGSQIVARGQPQTMGTALGMVTKIQYTVTTNGAPTNGTKTLIDGLKTGEKAWRKRAEEAVWSALCSGALRNPPNWQGIDSDGVTWKGKHDDGVISTIYPDI
jgi:hypothetical protein